MTRAHAIGAFAILVGILIAWGRLAAHFAAPRVVERRVDVLVPQPAPECVMPEHYTALGPCDVVMHNAPGATYCDCVSRDPDGMMTYSRHHGYWCDGDAGRGLSTGDRPW